MWPYGKDSPCIDLSDPDNVQRLFVFCVRNLAVAQDQREIFFAEAAHDVRVATRKRGGILKEHIWKNERTAMRIDLYRGREMIQELDSGETARRKAELHRRDELNRCQNASFQLQILSTDDCWTHPTPLSQMDQISVPEVPIADRYWLKPTEKLKLLRDEEIRQKAAIAKEEEARLEREFGKRVDDATDEDVIDWLGDNTFLIRFFHTTEDRSEAMKTLRPYLLRALSLVPMLSNAAAEQPISD